MLSVSRARVRCAHAVLARPHRSTLSCNAPDQSGLELHKQMIIFVIDRFPIFFLYRSFLVDRGTSQGSVESSGRRVVIEAAQ